eukprot:bmy_10053T0
MLSCHTCWQGGGQVLQALKSQPVGTGGPAQTPQAEKHSKPCPAPAPLPKVRGGPWSSHGKAVHSSSFTYEDKGFYDKIATSFSEQLMEGNESSPTDVPSQKESGKLDVKEQEEGRPVGEPDPRPAFSTRLWGTLVAGPRVPAA